MNQLTDKVLHAIKEQHIAPKPRWQFLLQRWILWVAAAFSILLGSVAFSVMLFRLVNNDWEVLKLLERTPLEHLIHTLPVLWLVVLVLFVWLAYYNARHTSGAYKYHAYWLVTGSIVMSFGVGSIMYAFGLAPQVEQLVYDQMPWAGGAHERRLETWTQPERGLLAGEVLDLGSGMKLFQLEGFDGTVWVVQRSADYSEPPRFSPAVGAFVRVTGSIGAREQYLFVADHVYPLFSGPGIRGGILPQMPRHLPPAGY